MDLNIIKQVKEAVNIPVIGNGDIKTIKDAERMLKSPIQEYAESPEAVQQLLDELGIF